MRSKRNRQAMAFTDKEHEKINILVDKVESKQEDRIREVKKMVTEVTGIMKDNIEKVVEREGKLNTLEVRTSELELSSQSFKVTSTQVVKKYRSRHRKLVCIIVLTIFCIFLLGGIIVFMYFGGVFSQTTPAPPATSPVPNRNILYKNDGLSTSLSN
ncbi:uncharacterized protein LOC133199751 [Saccostrea echinata]|uniref:uncharacterized protein LOC133199751 n=1 Tax=Saccostrea echinata TaxID=191078 RepID=UPI002A83E50B|nr:uncharacterized protein LOC133199751 [Saccostrea echinata]